LPTAFGDLSMSAHRTKALCAYNSPYPQPLDRGNRELADGKRPKSVTVDGKARGDFGEKGMRLQGVPELVSRW
jgi:hypothetical protein